MILKQPFIISSRLLPVIIIGGAEIQLEYAKQEGREGRTRYRWTIDLPDGTTHTGNDLQSGCQGGNLQEGFQSLLSFLTAAGESYRYKAMDGENSSLFPEPVTMWASLNISELEMASLELEENPGLIEE